MKSTFISDSQHAKIKDLAIEETKRKGRFVSIQDVIEEVVDIGIVKIQERKSFVSQLVD